APPPSRGAGPPWGAPPVYRWSPSGAGAGSPSAALAAPAPAPAAPPRAHAMAARWPEAAPLDEPAPSTPLMRRAPPCAGAPARRPLSELFAAAAVAERREEPPPAPPAAAEEPAPTPAAAEERPSAAAPPLWTGLSPVASPRGCCEGPPAPAEPPRRAAAPWTPEGPPLAASPPAEPAEPAASPPAAASPQRGPRCAGLSPGAAGSPSERAEARRAAAFADATCTLRAAAAEAGGRRPAAEAWAPPRRPQGAGPRPIEALDAGFEEALPARGAGLSPRWAARARPAGGVPPRGAEGRVAAPAAGGAASPSSPARPWATSAESSVKGRVIPPRHEPQCSNGGAAGPAQPPSPAIEKNGGAAEPAQPASPAIKRRSLGRARRSPGRGARVRAPLRQARAPAVDLCFPESRWETLVLEGHLTSEEEDLGWGRSPASGRGSPGGSAGPPAAAE
ncbi:unnamed protein product, partial [Prorocentrum cordatum]